MQSIFSAMQMKLFYPERFQGTLTASSYFEGWYFKQVSKDRHHAWSFIPGISLARSRKHAFIQIINGVTGETRYVEYDLREFHAARNCLEVRIGDSVFTDRYMLLAIKDGDFTAHGKIDFVNRVRYPRSLSAPGIMGWYSYVPFMECNHGVVSVNHSLDGAIIVNDHAIDFSGGKGYIEKDWGASFPEAWIWLQCNTFAHPEQSLFFSVAKIPWLGKHFTGLISFLYDQGTFYTFATYNGAKIRKVNRTGNALDITLENKKHILGMHISQLSAGELAAPVLGEMTRKIKESIDSEVRFELSEKNGRLIARGSGRRAGLEIIEKIFDYL
ncbi:MAG: tocopherol cyclase family protein [Chitinispirillaceae bacterium]|jgi:hypothetical protein|nr:tocopherol cyclase family protein [Chitinispirillaceae bacterium]